MLGKHPPGLVAVLRSREGNRLGSLALEIGRVLRRIRKERGLTLKEVAAASGGAFKATSVAGYERGERSVTLERFVLLCRLYGTSPARVLDEIDRADHADVVVDLSSLEGLGDQERELLGELLRRVSELRAGAEASELMVRADDLTVLANAAGVDADDLLEALRGATSRG